MVKKKLNNRTLQLTLSIAPQTTLTMNKWKHLLLMLLLFGCSTTKYVEGPKVDNTTPLESITVEEIVTKKTTHVINKEDLNRFRPLFSGSNWEANEKNLPASHKITLTYNGQKHTYWLGAISDLKVFPCYKLCSGFWLAPTGPEGQIDNSKIRTLATSIEMFRLGNLIHYDSEVEN